MVDSTRVHVHSDQAPSYVSSSVLQLMDISHVTHHSSSMSRRPHYEVFLSFRGPDTRKNFADILYMMLTAAGICVFRDEEELERGKEILLQLKAAIERSKISIPVISKDFASSKSCLMELQQMLECMDQNQHIIIPIFYHVDPSDVRNCKGSIQSSFDEHKNCGVDDGLIDSWKSTLHRIGELKGYHLHQTSEVSDGELLKQIIRQVRQKLKKDELIVPKLIGVDLHVQCIMEKLNVGYCNGQAVKLGDTCNKALLIHGVAGVGKTVLAKYVYNQLYQLFDACSFLGEIQAEIERHGILSLQNKLISDLHRGDAPQFNSSDGALIHIQNRFLGMKILLLLDDVYDHEHLSAHDLLSALVGELRWLDPGSRVILTSQNQHALIEINNVHSFFLEPMKEKDAMKLFCRHAFGMDSPPEEFKNLSTDIVAVTDGLPLALKVVGSSLRPLKSKKAWMETLTEWKVAPQRGVQAAFEKSFANLDRNAQQVFLDIACFFIGKDKRIPHYMWHDCNYSPSKSILALCAWSLVEVGQNKELCMLKLLKNFGWEIVKSENPSESCKRSRLYNHEEALHVLKTGKGTEKVEGLRLEFGDGSEGNISFKYNQFNGLHNLRYLKLDQADMQGNFGDHLSSLRWLDWQGCPKFFDVQSLVLNLQNLVILDLSWSQINKHWGGWKLLAEAKKLKVLKLTSCVQLIATPKFPLSMKLERLILEGCSRLAVIDRSFGSLEELVYLNMKQCSLLYELPDLGPMKGLKELVIDKTAITQIDFREGSLRKLKILSARDCKALTEISDSIGCLQSLKYLTLDGTGICALQESFGLLEELRMLSLKNCRRLRNLPDGIGMLRSLQILDLSDSMIRKLPPSVKDLKAMEVLRMRGTFIQEFPEDILNLEKLEEIDFSFCQSLVGTIPYNIWRLSSLAILNLSNTHISGLPESLSRLPRFQKLDISGCDDIQSFPELPFSLIIRDDN